MSQGNKIFGVRTTRVVSIPSSMRNACQIRPQSIAKLMSAPCSSVIRWDSPTLRKGRGELPTVSLSKDPPSGQTLYNSAPASPTKFLLSHHEQYLNVRTAVLNKMTCSLISAAKFPSSLVRVPFVWFRNVKVILDNPNPTSSLWLLPSWDVYLTCVFWICLSSPC